MSRDTGGQAFPRSGFEGDTQKAGPRDGMTLRDYFAAKALAAMIGNTAKDDCTRGASGVAILTKYAYEYADSMISARAAP